MEVPVDRRLQELAHGGRRELPVGHREHEAGVAERRDRPRPDRQPAGERGQRPPAVVQQPGQADGERAGDGVRQVERAEHRGEGAAGDPRDREQPADPLGVAGGELEHRVDAHRPAHEDGAVDPEVVHHRQRVLDELVDADPAGVGRPVRAAGAAVVPAHDPDAAVGVEQRRPRPRAGAEAVAEHDGRPVDLAVGVVGPRPQPGAVVGEHVGEGEPSVGRPRTRYGIRRGRPWGRVCRRGQPARGPTAGTSGWRDGEAAAPPGSAPGGRRCRRVRCGRRTARAAR